MRGILAKQKRKTTNDQKLSDIETVISLDTIQALAGIDAMREALRELAKDTPSAEEIKSGKLNTFVKGGVKVPDMATCVTTGFKKPKDNADLQLQLSALAKDVASVKNELDQLKNREHKHGLEAAPHIRVDIDDINNVPKVFVDGVDVTDDKKNHSALRSLHINWEANTEIVPDQEVKRYEV